MTRTEKAAATRGKRVSGGVAKPRAQASVDARTARAAKADEVLRLRLDDDVDEQREEVVGAEGQVREGLVADFGELILGAVRVLLLQLDEQLLPPLLGQVVNIPLDGGG